MASRDDADDKPNEDEEDASATEPVSPKPPPAKSEGKTRKRPGSKVRRSGAQREAKAEAQTDDKNRPAAGWAAWSRPLAVAAVALAAGSAAGWFGRDAQAKAKLRAESAPAASGSGPCSAWEQKICESSGDRSAACEQAKNASELLTPGTCEIALAAVPATLAKIKAARASCDELATKLCNDLPKGSDACKMVTDRTPSLPADRCKEMLGHYDEVLNQLKGMDQQGGVPGGPPGGNPHGAPPGAMPHGRPPQ